MTLLTDQEIEDIWEAAYGHHECVAYKFARAIEAKARAKLIEEIKAQGPEGMCKIIAGGKTTHYYHLPEGD